MMPLSQTRLLIRADGGPSVGTGHVMRMLALGQAYRRRGGQVSFVVGDLPKSLVHRLETERFQVYQIASQAGETSDAFETQAVADTVRPHWIVLDGYSFDDTYQSWFANRDSHLMVMDDYGHAQHKNADLVVNQNVYATPEMYDLSVTQQVLAGPQYALLRDEFHTTTERKFLKQARRVLVTFGGADADNWTLRTLQILSDLNLKRIVVDCVVGNCYRNFPELEEFKRHAKMTLRIHKNVDRMSALMVRADLAITGGGSTCYELARCGVPAIVTSIADNQIPVAEALNEIGAMQSIDHALPPSKNRCRNLAELVKRLIHDDQVRRSLSETASRIVDGRGAFRIADQMAAALMTLRDAREDDAYQLWQWRNDPEVRAVSFNSDAIPLESHQNWLMRRIHDPTSRIWVAQNTLGQAFGQVRFDIEPSTERATISIIVDQQFRSRGVGTALLCAAVEKLFQTTSAKEVLAQVKAGNLASERAFRNAGFQVIEPIVLEGTMAQQFILPRGVYRWNSPRRRVSA